MIRRWHTGVEFLNEVCSADAAQFLLDSSALLGFVPEEELALCEFLTRSLGAEHRFQSIRVVTRIPSLGADGHRRRREVLHLLQVEVELLCEHRKFCHVLLTAARVRADEVRNYLLVEMLLTVDAVEDALELAEELERRLAHELEHRI